MNKIKYLIISGVLAILGKLRFFSALASIYNTISLKKMRYEDILSWRVEMARRNGVKIGENCRLYSLDIFSEPYLVEIGNQVIISGDVKLITHDGAIYLFKERDYGGVYGKIIIGDYCFIGMSAILTAGTIIGDNCIIGAGAVVRGEVPSNSVVLGNPAKTVFKTSMLKKIILNSTGVVEHLWDNENLRREKILKRFSDEMEGS